MTALLYRTFAINVGSTMPSFVVVLLFCFPLPFPWLDYLSIYTILLATLPTVFLLQRDRKDRWYELAPTLPISPQAVVGEKYLLSDHGDTAGAALSAAAGPLFGLGHGLRRSDRASFDLPTRSSPSVPGRCRAVVPALLPGRSGTIHPPHLVVLQHTLRKEPCYESLAIQRFLPGKKADAPFPAGLLSPAFVPSAVFPWWDRSVPGPHSGPHHPLPAHIL